MHQPSNGRRGEGKIENTLGAIEIALTLNLRRAVEIANLPGRMNNYVRLLRGNSRHP
jgi:hypothetical protein